MAVGVISTAAINHHTDGSDGQPILTTNHRLCKPENRKDWFPMFMSKIHRQKLARSAVRLDNESKSEKLPIMALTDPETNYTFIDDTYDGRIQSQENSDINPLKRCIDDYNFSNYFELLSDKETEVNFEYKGQRGIRIRSQNGKMLAIMSNAQLAEISLLDKNSEIEYLSIEEVGSRYGNDFEKLTHELETNMAVINRHISNVHKHTWPKLYYTGGHVGMTEDDCRNLLAKKFPSYRAYREALEAGPTVKR